MTMTKEFSSGATPPNISSSSSATRSRGAKVRGAWVMRDPSAA